MSWLPDLGGRRTKDIMMSLTTLSLFFAYFQIQGSDFDITKAILRSNGQRSVNYTRKDVVVNVKQRWIRIT